uniref:Uncharacterized protein n=1 Tax=Setaria digitata TaxID=48799 RepID=A0A915PC01_9BILA
MFGTGTTFGELMIKHEMPWVFSIQPYVENRIGGEENRTD